MSGSFDPEVDVQSVRDEASLVRFLDQLEARLEAISETVSQMEFTQYETKVRPPQMQEWEAAEAALLNNTDYQETVSRFQDRVCDPLLARRLTQWQRTFRAARVSARPEIRQLVNAISDEIVRFKYTVQGETLDLGGVRNVVLNEPDRERRRAAWLSFAPLSRHLDGPTRELLHLRNAGAKAEGFETYAHMQMQAQGLTLAQVVATLEELQKASAASYRSILGEGAERCGIGAGQVQPWDVKYLLGRQDGMPEKTFRRAGIADRLAEWGRDHGCELERLGISVHWMDIPYNGLCLQLGRGDIRILGNPVDGHTYYETAFHELGHSLHAAFSNPGSPILLSEPAVFAEGMAEMLGYTANDPDWLRHVGLGEAEVAAAGRLSLGPWFTYLRQRSAYALFEYAAYADPDGPLDRTMAEVEARQLGCAVDESPRWAAEPNAWFSRYPVYWQNYVLADVVASQIHHDLRRRFGSVWRNQAAVDYMREQYWAPGGAVDWQEKLRRGTGEDLSTAALVADLEQAGAYIAD